MTLNICLWVVIFCPELKPKNLKKMYPHTILRNATHASLFMTSVTLELWRVRVSVGTRCARGDTIAYAPSKLTIIIFAFIRQVSPSIFFQIFCFGVSWTTWGTRFQVELINVRISAVWWKP